MTVLLGALAALVSGWIMQIPAQIFNPLSTKDKIRSGPDFSVSVDLVRLDDEGESLVTRSDYRPAGSVLRFISRPEAAASPKFSRLIRSIGGINLDNLTARITVTGHRNQRINILDIRPRIVERRAPWSGTFFCVPPQGGYSTMNMMFDMDRPRPIARDVRFDDAGVVPGRPFFSQRTITLRDNEQQVIVARAVTAHHYVAFRFDVTYMLGDRKKEMVVDDHGRPFQVTAISPGPHGKGMSYRRILALQDDFSLCEVKSSGARKSCSPC